MKKKLGLLWASFVFLLIIISMASINKNTNLKKVIDYAGVQIDKDQLWVEVALEKKKHTVIVRKGEEIVKEMPCSGGTEQEPTILGVFYLENRGEWFYSERYDEGALYWVRFYEQYLFHSVPIDKEFNVLEEEKKLIGTAASHGCVRLLEEDAKWFYYNVPDDTMVVIHD
ncbi:MAG: hypothetical protein CVV02_15570 [Firmicutes bacterium HGW-Firmicutes-7]|nr:MAG: hypothetical protein CVV02_15570 [Firmicutes bacterium HGW-Firmicutes-7]